MESVTGSNVSPVQVSTKLLPLAQDRLPTLRRAGLRPALGVVHDHIGVAEVAEGGFEPPTTRSAA
jgi:hypothetical protein